MQQGTSKVVRAVSQLFADFEHALPSLSPDGELVRVSAQRPGHGRHRHPGGLRHVADTDGEPSAPQSPGTLQPTICHTSSVKDYMLLGLA